MGHRYLPNYSLPETAYFPGNKIHPKLIWDKMVHLDLHHPENSITLRHSIDLFNHDFFWESHMGLEALWNDQKRKGDEARFFQSMIHLAGAGINFKLKRIESAIRHLLRSTELLNNVDASVMLGFQIPVILDSIEKKLSSDSSEFFQIHPEWK
jgi:hypothetical protein